MLLGPLHGLPGCDFLLHAIDMDKWAPRCQHGIAAEGRLYYIVAG
jgi:hypothetical protein